MADAFGLAAGVIQVADFGLEVGTTIWTCAKKFHNANKELREISTQVNTAALSLRRVDALLKEPATQALHTPKLYEDTKTVSDGCLGVFQELDDHFKSFALKSGVQEMTVRSKARWLFDSNKLHGLGQVLRHYSDVLHLMISAMAIVEGRRTAYEHNETWLRRGTLTEFIVPRTRFKRWRSTFVNWRDLIETCRTPTRP